MSIEPKALAFVPAVVAPELPKEPKPPRAKRRAQRRRTAAIEVEASGITVRISDGASSATIAAVIRALKVTS
jgi:transposase